MDLPDFLRPLSDQARHDRHVKMIVDFVSKQPPDEQLRIMAGMVRNEIGCNSQVPYPARHDAIVQLLRLSAAPTPG